MKKTMSFKTALRLAESVQMWVHIDGKGGFRIDVSKAAIMRNHFYDEAPSGSQSSYDDEAYEAYDDSGRTVWGFDGVLLQIG